MEHIKTPVTVGRGMLFEPDRQGLPVPLADVYTEGRLNGELEKTREIAHAINAYDDLVAQRDALAAACRLFTRAYYGNGGTDVNWELYDRAALDALAALALVKGENATA